MSSVLIPERWESIIRLVDERGGATVEDISISLGISAATVRRDLMQIHRRGLVKRTWGGAAPNERVYIAQTLSESRKVNPGEKELIGRAASQLVKAGDTLMIDGGFTTHQVARQIEAGGITVVTNSLDVTQALVGRDDVELLVIGGKLRTSTGTTVGFSTVEQILSFRADKAILGADAISPQEGLSSPSSFTAETKKAMIRQSREVIVVADYSKLGRTALCSIASIEAVGTLITDDKADPTVVEAFRAAGVNVIIASVDSQ